MEQVTNNLKTEGIALFYFYQLPENRKECQKVGKLVTTLKLLQSRAIDQHVLLPIESNIFQMDLIQKV